jgi:hypothetical protein
MHRILTAVAIASPKISLSALCVFFLIWQAPVVGPEWRDVAVGALGIVTTMATVGLGYFIHTIKEDRKRQARRHKTNVQLLVAIVGAIKSGKHEELTIDGLFHDDEALE